MNSGSYKSTATLLWAVAGLLLGYSLGEFIQLSPRQSVFMAALIGGGIVLWRVNQRVAVTKETPKLESGAAIPLPPASPEKDQSLERSITPYRGEQDPLDTLLHSSDTTPLSSEQAREVLNELLTRQQADS